MNASFTAYFILISVLLSGLMFETYRAVFRRVTDFRARRFALLALLVLAAAMPFNPTKIAVQLPFLHIEKQAATVFQPVAYQTATVESAENLLPETVSLNTAEIKPSEKETPAPDKSVPWQKMALGVYALVGAALLFRLLRNIVRLIKGRLTYSTEKTDNFILVHLPENQSACSFFRWIFINDSALNDDEKRQIITHEKIHASQYHSLDILFVELLSAVMWFNPFVWMIKRELRLVHEYLADDEASGGGVEKIRYQALLLNQAAGEKLIGFSSHFNHSIIKKRIMMMDTKKINKNGWRKSLWFLPVIALFAIGTALVNGQNKSENEKTNAKTIALTANQQNEASIFDVFKTRFKSPKQESLGKFRFLSGKMADNIKWIVPLQEGKENDMDMISHFFPETKNADDLAFDPAYFTSYPSDSELFTEMLNKELKSRKKVSDTEQLWGRFYSVKNNPNSPLILNVGYTEKLKNDKSEATKLIKEVITKTEIAFFEPTIKNATAEKSNKKLTIVIDPGHGGKDNGALSQNGLQEKEITLAIAKKLREITAANGLANVVLTRDEDKFVSLSDRTKMGKDADLYLSLHINADNNKSKNGISVYSSETGNYKEKSDLFTSILNKKLGNVSGISTSNTVLRANFYLLKENQCPTVLLNVGYMSNEKDMNFLKNKGSISLIAQKIADAVAEFRKG